MPELTMEPVWVLRVTARELTLIRAALGDRLREDQYEEAEALDTALAKRVVAETKNKLDAVGKLERNLVRTGDE